MLDIGCSGGTLSLLINDAVGGDIVYGTDISESGVQEAERKGIKVTQVDIDSSSLPYENDFFDFVYCGDVIEHVFNPSHLLDEANRVTKPGGYLLLTTPNLASWYNRILLPLGYQPFETAASLSHPRVGKIHAGGAQISDLGGEHIRVMTLKALKDLLKIHNYQILKIKGAHGTTNTKSYLLKIVQLLDQIACTSPALATWFVVKAIKAQK
jgi:ubiquinone/menaquinone biosynthesis C-methylase UbiE